MEHSILWILEAASIQSRKMMKDADRGMKTMTDGRMTVKVDSIEQILDELAVVSTTTFVDNLHSITSVKNIGHPVINSRSCTWFYSWGS